MAGLGQNRGDARLRSGRKRSVLRGADTIITVETGLNTKPAPTRATTLGLGKNVTPGRASARNRPNRQARSAGSQQLRKIDAVGTPDVGKDIISNEEQIAKAFGTGGVRL